MNNRFLSWLFILTSLLAVQNVMAYELKLDGLQVTDDNKDNIRPSSLSKGTISFSGSTLTLTNVEMYSNTKMPLIENTGIDKLTILIVGKCKLTGLGSVIQVSKETTISGGSGVCATLEITSERSSLPTVSRGIFVRNNSTLYIRDIHLTATGYHYGISGEESGDYANQAVIRTWSSHLKAVCDAVSGRGSLVHFSASYRTKADTQLPTGATFDKTKHGYVDSSGNLYYNFEITNPFMVNNVIVHGTDYHETTQTLKPEGLTAGTIVYDIANKKLTLDGVQWSGWSSFIDNHRDDVLKVVAGGFNNISTSAHGINTDKSLVIEGDVENYKNNHLTITSSNYNAINVAGDSLVLRNVGTTVTGYSYGIYGHDTNNNLLTIDKSSIDASATMNEEYSSYIVLGRAIAGFTQCTMKEADVLTNNTTFRPAYRAFATDTGKQPNKVQISVPTTYYDIYILGHQLNNVNASYPGIEGLKGSVIYNQKNSTLSLDGVTISGSNGSVGGLVVANNAAKSIELVNDNNIVLDGNCLVLRNSEVRIKGYGSLKCDGGSRAAVYCGGGLEGSNSLTINVNNKVSFIGDKNGLNGDANCTVNLQRGGSNSCYIFNANAPISGIAQLSMANMEISNQGCFFYSRLGRVRDNLGNVVTGEVRILPVERYYPIWVCDKQLNDVNCKGLGASGIRGANDAVTFNPSTYTLNIKSANLTPSKNTITTEYTNDLKIHFEGQVTLSNSYENIYLNGNTTFTASPDAQVTIASNGYTAISTGSRCETLAFDGISNMNISGNKGILSTGATQLNILNSSMSVTGVEEVVSGFENGINLQGCVISAPTGAKVVGGNICNASGQVLKNQTVVISGIPTAISALSSETDSDSPYYSLDGLRINGKPTKSGLYVRDGKKVVVK